MVTVSLDRLQIPFYGLVAGAFLTIWLFVKSIQGFRRWSHARANGCQPPAHSVCHSIFGIGMIIELAKAGPEHRFLELIRGWHQSYGPTFKARIAHRRVIFTSEPQNIQAMLALKFEDFSVGSTRRHALRAFLGEGIFGVDGSAWEHSRAILRPSFSRTQINDTELYESHVVSLIEQIPRDGSTVDLLPLFLKSTIDTATEFLFGESTHTLRKEGSSRGAEFTKAFDTIQDVISLRFRVGGMANLYRRKAFYKAVAIVRAYVDKFVQKAIDYRVAVDSGRKVDQDIKQLTDSRYVLSYELSKETLDKTIMTDQLLSIMFAGRDTTASLLSVVFWILARRPDVWDRLRKEVLALNGEKPPFEVLKSMTYLTWVLNETLRLYPTAPFNLREATKDTYLPVGGGLDGKSPIHIPKGHEIIFSVYTMHRENEIYGPDPDEFRPERWEHLRPGWAYLPFNGGPRTCIGQQFALTETGYTIVRIMQQFESIETRDPDPWVEHLGLTLANANGTKVSFTPVKN
ncbi:Cytochrome P450 [Penicillium coprophilum]|uniref:Cytochrome P450 n=1 Tax=Penicillium coprophilum TaxID=36646 RepID=UPI00239FE040|nr:Cytochrome P450 [Penicillium coprophilum]KAJ5173648.1 Cytochrome P450 [Penicillium coprophilum]